MAFIPFLYLLITSYQTFSQNHNDAAEPSLSDVGTIDLLKGGTLNAWKVPSDRWLIEDGIVVANTGEEVLDLPEWLYTKEEFSDFVFQCELKLTGDNRRNTGIYYRVQTFPFEGYKSFEAPSGYEFDAAYHNPGDENLRGSLGDWYSRPSLRVYADQKILDQAYKEEKWNRMTIRARDNRLEYWINGIKIMDFRDDDPDGSRNGVIGFQIHDGSVMEVQFRNIYILPIGPQR